MRKFLLMALAALMLSIVAACGGAAESPTEARSPTVAPTAVPPTQAPPTDTPVAMKEDERMESDGSVSAEMEMLRLGAIQKEVGLLKNVEKFGMEFSEFSPGLRAQSDKAVVDAVIPNRADRVGLDSPWIDVFNGKMGHVVGYRIESDGTVTKIPKFQQGRGRHQTGTR